MTVEKVAVNELFSDEQVSLLASPTAKPSERLKPITPSVWPEILTLSFEMNSEHNEHHYNSTKVKQKDFR